VALLLCVRVSLPLASQAQTQTQSPDTVAAKRIVDSLVRVGAWRLPTRDTVRAKPDTVRVPVDYPWVDEAIHGVTFAIALTLLGVLALLTYKLGSRFDKELKDRPPVGLRSRWAGFGGGDGGWEMTPALSLLTLTVVIGILTAIVASTVLEAGMRWNDRAPANASAPATASAAPPNAARK
jgi:hypothetical protein